MKNSIIVAISDNNVIGKDNALLWRLSADMRFFKEKTTGHHIIMGRKTFESLGNRLLPNRTSIVISRNAEYQLPEGGILVTSIENAIAKVKDETEAFSSEENKFTSRLCHSLILCTLHAYTTHSTAMRFSPKLTNHSGN